ncbi:hypothetical protein CROQUDRAFT_132385 [Cronartium quercuum f. sp. fusiforme G11]|uniref:Protein SMG7 n=1 Tax=Cronartium quercuum f. sp. fusiforme G11 TaxID=708437 RepID=A0A9P6NPB4_9BASI|nr:hypothetical protein CROQUDRAFT_132385 [Cronartium quercuum f. sp. fusiforme G11]
MASSPNAPSSVPSGAQKPIEDGTYSPPNTITHLDIARTKTLAAKLKAALAQPDPSPRELDSHRQNVRRQYMALIFGSDETASGLGSLYQQQHALEILNLLWLDTSHAFISLYRRQIMDIDRRMAEAIPEPRRRGRPANYSPRPGPVARRKLVQRFRAFLHAEHEFWKTLINRLVVAFKLKHAQNFLRLLKITTVDPLAPPKPALQDLTTSSLPGPGPIPVPIESSEIQSSSLSFQPVERPLGRFVVHKALICFGDLTRYRELYAQPTSRTKPAFNPPRSSRGQQQQTISQRDWSKAYECYNQARLLLPTNGNPSNQLAVLASYMSDNLSSAYHYYRALCVKEPFPTAKQNLRLTFNKALSKWAHAPDSGLQTAGNDESSVARFQADFVALHAILFTHNMFELVTSTNLSVCALLSQTLQERLLSPELILKVVVMTMAAVWQVRVTRKTPNPGSALTDQAVVAPLVAELATTTHLLDLFTTFLTVAIDELLSTAPPSSDDQDLSLAISAVLRRILPALRLITKWLLAGNLEYLSWLGSRLESKTSVLANSDRKDFRAIVSDFRSHFDEFVVIIQAHFPIGHLPNLSQDAWLEEDLEMTGFLPLQKGLSAQSDAAAIPLKRRLSTLMVDKTVHPNEEYLMRLADIQRDVQLMTAVPRMPSRDVPAPVKEEDVNEDHDEPIFVPQQDRVTTRRPSTDVREPENPEDNMDCDYDEDPVEMAMRAVVAHQVCEEDADVTEGDRWAQVDDDEGDDEVVYLPSSLTTPPWSSNAASTVLPTHTLSTATLQPIGPSNHSPSPPGAFTTAADLLALMTGKSKPAPPSELAPASPSGWSSAALATNFHALQNTHATSPGVTSRIMGARAPSISLPKPIESRANIWANEPSNEPVHWLSFSFSSRPALLSPAQQPSTSIWNAPSGSSAEPAESLGSLHAHNRAQYSMT